MSVWSDRGSINFGACDNARALGKAGAMWLAADHGIFLSREMVRLARTLNKIVDMQNENSTRMFAAARSQSYGVRATPLPKLRSSLNKTHHEDTGGGCRLPRY